MLSNVIMNDWLDKTIAFIALFSCFGVAIAGAQTIPANRIISVPAHKATCMVAHDSAGMLAIAEHDSAGAGCISVCALDSSGNLATNQPLRVVLPMLATQQKRIPIQPLGLSFHPNLPLLYIWQDAVDVDGKPKFKKEIFAELNHLTIFSIISNKLDQVFKGAAGELFDYGAICGLISMDPEGRRLFLPNICAAGETKAGIGYYDLDANGLPFERDGHISMGSIDVSSLRERPTGFGFVPASRKVVIFCGVNGPATWDTENRLAPLNVLPLAGVPARDNWIAGHPSLPIVYGAGAYGLFGMEYSNGFPTQLPWKLIVSNANFFSPPAIMTRTPSFLAVGGKDCIWFVPLDATGRFAGSGEPMQFPNSSIRALSYSMRFDRLYVAADKNP